VEFLFETERYEKLGQMNVENGRRRRVEMYRHTYTFRVSFAMINLG
jgi:hypothetical protein